VSAATPLALDVASAARATESPRFLSRLFRRRLALVCLSYLALVVAVAIVAPLALPGVAREQAGDLLSVRQVPSWHHLLGTDALGRDVLDRLLVGTRVTIVGVAEALVVVLVLGVPVGLAAGFFGGWLDRLIGWLADLAFSVPGLVIVLVVLSIFPYNMLAAMGTLGVIVSPGLMRLVRSATLPIREELYIAAARVSGLSRPYIISRHVLPRIAGPVIVQGSLLAAGALLAQSGLAYLGLLVQVPAPSWGGMINDGISAIVLQPWLVWPPGIAVAGTVLALGLLGDAVRDATTESWSAPVRRPSHRSAAPARSTGQTGFVATRSSLLVVDGLTVTFPSSPAPVVVVEDVSFELASGEALGIVGESGCGKTVTALSILRLIPGGGEVASGRLLFDGVDLAAMPEPQLRRLRGKEIGFVSQEPMVALNPVFTVGSQLAHSVRWHRGVSRRAARQQAIELLKLVRIAEPELAARRYPHELSGGMAQRVAIARALAGEPKLLIADEPTTALDVTVQAEILQLLRELQRERGMAILLVTHDWGVVADLCDRAVVMYAGQVVERARISPLFRQPLHPYTEALLASNPYHALTTEFLPTIPGSVPKPGGWPVGCHFHPRCGYATSACRQGAIRLEHPAPDRETRCIHHQELLRAR
jgi:peptide/nickel transport system permease protein